MKLKYSILAILTVLVFLFMPVAKSQAQSKFGIRGGLNVSNISFDNLPDRGERFGFHAGIFADLPILPDFIHLQPELSYSLKGVAFKFLGDRETLNMKYIDFLLPVAFRLGSIDLQVGPFASYLISKPDYKVFDNTEVIVDAFKKTDVGLTAGLSYNFAPVTIGIRYNQGMVDISNDKGRPFLGSGKTAVGQVSLGFKF
ncbi:MAG: PorT family protein [Saprospiraceae bacterium]|nr:MAG: PorT family protein [Saprospiraceae bacterium]